MVRPLDAACKERISAMRQKLQQIMFNDGGIERNKADLLRGSTDVFRLRQNVRVSCILVVLGVGLAAVFASRHCISEILCFKRG